MRNPGNLNPQREKYPVKKQEYPAMPSLKLRKRVPQKTVSQDDNFDDFANKSEKQVVLQTDAYPVPLLALGIIIVNMALWAIFMLLYWLGTASFFQAVGAFFVLILAMALYLAIQYILWRFFWWIAALSACLSTLALLYFVLAVFTGTTTLNSLRLPF